jgi:hypothetical protein
MDDEIEYLRLHGDATVASAQLAPIGVKEMIAEQKLQ